MEKYKKGGYTILDLESSTIYADSVKALDSNKPIVVYDGTNKPYFADTISLSGTNVVITKGGKTIAIANDNTITSVGDIQFHNYAVYFYGDDENSNTCYFYMNLLTTRNDLTTENVEDYLKEYIADINYSLTGYNGNDNSIYVSFRYFAEQTKFIANDNNDAEMTISDLSFNVCKKLF